jgi:putative ABC transport system permease protein
MGDLRAAIRALRGAPVVSAAAILSLALGIGANGAIFSILNTVLLRTLPVRDPDRLVMLADGSWTNPIWEQIRDRSDELFDGACAWGSERFDLAAGGQTDFVEGLWASGRLFDVLGVPAMLGRTFTAADDARGGGPDGPVAVIGYRFWQRHYGGVAGVIGQSITLNRLSFTIVGVTPPGFFGPEVGREFDVAVPIGTEPLLRGAESTLDNKGYWWLDIMARLKPGQSVETATAALRGVQPQIRDATLPTDWRPEWLETYLKEAFTLVPAAGGDSFLRRRYERPLLALMGIVALVLLVACANIANLLLARAAARRHELSVRLALGASRMRLARQLLGESLLLAAAGAALGLLFARWGGGLLVGQLSTASRPLFLDLSLDGRVLGFTSAVAVATALLFGTVPALRAARTEPSDALKGQGRGVAGERRMGVGQILVVTQVALSLVLVVGAGLFVRTFTSLMHRDLGFEKTGVLIVNVNAAKAAVTPDARAALFERVREAVATLPGVTGAATSMVTPVSGSTWMYSVEVEGEPAPPEQERGTHVNMISPGWFATYRTRLLAGRDFDDHDRDGAPAVAIVNEAFAHRFLQGANPIGRTILRPSRPGRVQPPLQVVGLVQDAVYRSLRDPAPPTMYVPFAQTPDLRPEANISVREAAGSPARLARTVADAIAGVDRNLSLTFRTLSDQVNASLTQDRLVAMLSGFFGGLALLLAALGLYGVTAYAVNRRRTEIGVRLALGANPAGIVRLVLSRVTWLVGSGIVSGVVISLWLSRLAGSLLWGLEPGDPATLAVAAAVLAAVGALAGWWPARRASHIDPAHVLREG